MSLTQSPQVMPCPWGVIPALAIIQSLQFWSTAFAGATASGCEIFHKLMTLEPVAELLKIFGSLRPQAGRSA
jgi:hypothetical protein